MAGTFVDVCKLVAQSETMAAVFHEAGNWNYRGRPKADATARDVLGLRYVRATDGETETATIGCGKALVDLELKLEYIPGPDNALVLESTPLRARSNLGLGGWILSHAPPRRRAGLRRDLAARELGRLTEYAWDRPIQWARYLVNTKDL